MHNTTRAFPAHDAAGAQTHVEMREVEGGVAIKGQNNPTSLICLDRYAAYRFAVALLATLNSEIWWFDRAMVAEMAQFMLQGGWAHSEVVRAVEMPWLYTEVHYRALDGS